MKNLCIACIFLLVIFNSCNSDKVTNEKKPNIVIIFSDELAPDYLSCYGGEIPTPNIDQLATNGIRFTNAYTPSSMCTPSRYAILTGQYPGRCTGKDFLEDYPLDQPYSIAWNTSISEDKQTIARVMKKEGYVTGAVGKWHNGMGEENIKRSFSKEDNLDDEEVNQKLIEYQKSVTDMVKRTAGFDYAASILNGNYDNFPIKQLAVHNIEWMTEGALQFFEEQKENTTPFFLYVATTAIHGPRHDLALESDVRYTLGGKMESLAKYQVKRENELKEIEGMPTYKRHLIAGMWFLDEHVGAIINKLKELELYDNTIIFFMADHNIEPGKATCYEKGNKVPFLIHWPSKVENSKVIDALVESVDILPTAVDIAHSTSINDLKLDGVSLLPLINGEKDQAKKYAYFESGYARAITNGQYKYIAFRPTEKMLNAMKNGETEFAPNYLNTPRQAHSQIAMQYFPSYFAPDQLFDLSNDPYEQNNLAENPDYEEIKTKMQEALDSIVSSFSHPYSLKVDPFMYSNEYKELAKNTKKIGTDFIPWWKEDHGEVKWPPQ